MRHNLSIISKIIVAVRDGNVLISSPKSIKNGKFKETPSSSIAALRRSIQVLLSGIRITALIKSIISL